MVIRRAEDGIYVAKIDDKVVFKMGPQMEMGNDLPQKKHNWEVSVCFLGFVLRLFFTT